MRNLRGRGFERYPAIFSTAARTGFLTAIAAAPQPAAALPMLLDMEFRHVRTLTSIFSRLRICRKTNDVYELNPNFELYVQLHRYLRELNGEIGEWKWMQSEVDVQTMRDAASRSTIGELFGSELRAAVLVTVGSTYTMSVESIAEYIARDHSAVERMVIALLRAGILQRTGARGQAAVALAESRSRNSLVDLLHSCDSVIKSIA